MEIFFFLSERVNYIFLEGGGGKEGRLGAIYKQKLLFIIAKLNIRDARPGSQMPSSTLSKFSKNLLRSYM